MLPLAHFREPSTVPPVDHVGPVRPVEVDHVGGQLGLVPVVVVVVVHPAQPGDVAVGVVDVASRG